MAYVSAAVYDAVTAIEGGYRPYGPAIDAYPGASVDGAVVEASYRTLSYYFPAQAPILDAFYTEALALIPAGLAKDDGKGRPLFSKLSLRLSCQALTTRCETAPRGPER